jgi:hypothetical protein
MPPLPRILKPTVWKLALLSCSALLLAGCATAPKLAPNAGPIERDLHARYAQIEDRIGDAGFRKRAAEARDADGGDASALRDLADFYLEELMNPPLALNLWRKAIQRGDAESCDEAGKLYLSRAYGVARNPARALNYFATALYLPITTSNLTEIRIAGDHALATALFEFNQPQWPEVQQVLERRHKLKLSFVDDDYAALSILAPDKYPPNESVRQVFRTPFPSRSDILAVFKYADEDLRDQVKDVRELYEIELKSREDLARIDAANRQQIGQAILGGLQNLSSSMAQTQATANAARAQAATGAQQANRPLPFQAGPIQPVFLNATAGGSGAPNAGDGSMRDLYLQAAQLCREAASRATDPVERERWEQAALENQRNADALLSNAPGLDTSPAVPPANPPPAPTPVQQPQPLPRSGSGPYATPAR